MLTATVTETRRHGAGIVRAVEGRRERRQLALEAAARREQYQRATAADREEYLRWRADNRRFA